MRRDLPLVRKTVRSTLRMCNVRGAVEGHLIGAEDSRRLNRRFRGKRTPATVLSFKASRSFPHPASGRVRYLGEMYLAPSVIRSRGETLPRYVVHGLLHLLGYTHRSKRDTIKMEALEARVLVSRARRRTIR